MNASLSRRALLPLSAAMAGAALLPAAAASAQPVLDERAGGIVLEAGVHRVGANVTIKTDLRLLPGATIEIAERATLTILGHFDAPVARVFTGAGKIDLNHSRTPHAHPEWWGAAPGDNELDSLAALRNCLLAHPVMRLLAADYYVSDTIIVERPFCRIAGAGFRGAQGWNGTRLILTSGSGDVMRVGPASAPPTVNDYPQNIDISSVALCRSVVPDAGARGLVAQYLLYARFEQVSAAEHGTGFSARGLVRSQFIDCAAFRSLPGPRAGTPWRGFLLNGMDHIGLAGGNASLFLTDCNATIGGDSQVSDSVGLLLEGAFADSFIINFETTSTATGIRVDGKAGQIGARARDGHVNLHLRMPIIDQCSSVGIAIRDTSAHMMIDIAEPYVAAGPRAVAAIRCDAMHGSLSISGGQLIGTTNSAAGGSAVGLMAQDSDGLQVQGLKILEHPRPVMLSGCRGFAVQGWIANPAFPTGKDAALLRDCQRGSVALLVSGKAGGFASGVAVLGDSARLRIDATGHDDAAFVGGATSRVRVGDRPVAPPYRQNGLLIDGA